MSRKKGRTINKEKNNLAEINLKLVKAFTELMNENQKLMKDEMSSFLQKMARRIEKYQKDIKKKK